MNTYQLACPGFSIIDRGYTCGIKYTPIPDPSDLSEIDVLKRYWMVAIPYYEAISSIFPGSTATKSESSQASLQTSDVGQDSDQVARYSRIQRMDSIADEYPGFYSDIERFRRQKRDWGKEGSKNPSGTTLDYAYEVFSDLILSARNAGISLPEPAVGRCADGSILFEWDLSGKSFELEFSKDNQTPHLSYLLCPVEDDDSTWQEGELIRTLSQDQAVRTFLSWL
ncbi:MAG: hypothetical protein WCJ75_17275 [Desulfomonile sp.]|jgi:hypothetical protein